MSWPERRTLVVLITVLAPAIAGCGMASMIETNTRAIQETTKAMNETAGVLGRSNTNMERMAGDLESLGPPMERVSSLSAPMKDVASLGPAMAELGAGMSRLEAQMGSMEKGLARLERPMEDVAALHAPMDEVAKLEGTLARVAKLDESMGKVAALRGPMEDVAHLRTSMETMANFGQGGPGVKTAIGALAAWVGATFLGVYLGFRAGMRRLGPSRRKQGARPRLSRARLGGAASGVVVVPLDRGGSARRKGRKGLGEDDARAPDSGVRRNLGPISDDRGSSGPAGSP